jgi:hypothetical protein
MRATRESLRDDPDNWDPKNWKLFASAPENEHGFDVASEGAGQIDGVVMVVGDDSARVESEWVKVATILGDSIAQAFVLNGAVRAPEEGHEQ